MHWAYFGCMILVQLVGLFLNILGLPGLWLMVGSAGIFAWLTRDAAYLSWPTILILGILALIAEVAEFVAGSAGARKAGASTRATIGGIIGALLGGILLSIPIPILGTIIGVCIGAFIGASAVELLVRNDLDHSLRVGAGAAKGRFVGIVIKLAIGVVILLISFIMCMPIGRATIAPTPPNAPATTAT